jgi:putative protease
MKHVTSKPELLAPAGSMEAFFAAMEKGADAVYTGLQEFSARARAKNFSLSQMEKMLRYAHAYDRRIYVTINTLIKEAELPLLVDTLAGLAAMRIDGVIVQDLGVARLIRNHFPSIPLHASTQMTIHNVAGVQMLQKLGFQRAVLARELALDEIEAIVKATPVEIEVFVHGALCFSVSGQCFFSSYLGGHSGNRGRCAQPCRRLYNHRGKQGYYFSTNDLSALDMIPAMAAAGVASLKIEGRMKSAEYVASVVEAYRKVLDAPESGYKDALTEGKELLKSSFGRTPTKGFLASQSPDDITNPWQKGGTGRYAGHIRSINGKRMLFETRIPLHVGDRLRVQPKSDMAGQAWTIREIFCSRKKTMEAAAGAVVEVDTPFTFETGDSIYKVSSNEAFTLSDNACQRRLESVQGAGQGMACSLVVTLQHEHVVIEAEVSGSRYSFSYPVGILEEARTESMEGVLRNQFAKTGSTPFTLASLNAPDFPPRLIPAALFKEMRRQFYRYLEDAVARKTGVQIAEARASALREIAGTESVRHMQPERLTVAMENPRDWRYPLQNGADCVLFELSKATIHALAGVLNQMRGAEGQIIWQLPFMIFDRDMALYRDTVQQLHRAGFRRFEATNLSHFGLFSKLNDIELSTGYRCFSTNSQALLAWHELGAELATLYLEDDGENLGQLLRQALPLERSVVVYAPLPVMTTKIRIKDAHTNTPLVSDRGERYRVTSRDGLQTVCADTPFSLTARHSELRRNRCSSYLIDLRQTPRETWNDILASFRGGREIPDTTEFNYVQGLI